MAPKGEVAPPLRTYYNSHLKLTPGPKVPTPFGIGSQPFLDGVSMSEFQEDHGVATKSKKEVRPPKRYKVLLLNDDYTTMEFVVFILETVFNKSSQQAHALMMSIHQSGSGVAGVYSFEIAEMKTAIVTELSRKHDYPLRCIMEEED